MKKIEAFTLIELAIVVLVIGILAAIAVPAYNEQVRKGKRSEVQQALLGASEAIERYKAANFSYTGVTLGGADGVFVNTVPVNGVDVHTQLRVEVTGGGSGYTLTSTPLVAGSMNNDCTFTITNTGAKGYTKGGKCTNVTNW